MGEKTNNKLLTYQVSSWGRSHRAAGGRTRPGCQAVERNPGSNRRLGPWRSPGCSHEHTHQNHRAHKSTGVQTNGEQTHWGSVYLSNMSLVSFNSLMVTASYSVNPHAWTEEEIISVKYALICEHGCVSFCVQRPGQRARSRRQPACTRTAAARSRPPPPL